MEHPPKFHTRIAQTGPVAWQDPPLPHNCDRKNSSNEQQQWPASGKFALLSLSINSGWMTGKPEVIPGQKFLCGRPQCTKRFGLGWV